MSQWNSRTTTEMCVGCAIFLRICVPARQWPSINSHSLGTTSTKRRGTTVIGTWCSRLSQAAECIWADLTAWRTPPTFCLGAADYATYETRSGGFGERLVLEPGREA
jgi:hypothetical protein